ncbi:MAG: response regulator [Chloroflexi bacterium]|nr:response regulator [Chloroflexota bacterium]MCY3914371.1 response regulator [Chloroflexota bacterium]
MQDGEDLRSENERLRSRISRLTEAILRISQHLELETVLQDVADSARSLTEARYAAITTINDSGDLQDLVFSGLTSEGIEQTLAFSDGPALLQYLSGLQKPLRTRDFVAHIKLAGFPDFTPNIGTFLSAQIGEGGNRVGTIFIGEKKHGLDFTLEDEETLEMFAAQAATAITNARRYGDEQRAKADQAALVETSPVGVMVLDAKTRELVQFNEEARRIGGGVRGQGRDYDHGLSLFAFRRMDGREIPRAEMPVERALSGETVRAEEMVIHRPDGETVTALVNATPIRSEDGEIVSVVSTVQDITPLEELERLRAEFLGMVSHELRTPLTSIKGSAATARSASVPLDPAETRQFFRIIEEQADHMRDLINNLLDLARIEAGTLSVAPELTDIGDVIHGARDAFLGSGYRNSVAVSVAPDLRRIPLDRQRVSQVLYNLFTNASKYSREWSAIRVTASLQDLYVAVSVTDEGRGISAEQLPRLFSKFSRIDFEHGPEIEGAGLGLAICRGIVEAHGGRIWAESDGEGKGTRFTFTLPAVDTMAEPSASPEAASTPGASAGWERVLAVDDDPQVLRYVRNVLSEAGYSVTVTSEPAEFDHLIQAEQPHLVLLNLMLPGTSGFELITRIPNVFEVPVIFLSGRGRAQDFAQAFEMGAADYLVKPFAPTELVARIRAALHKRSVYRQAQAVEPFRIGNLTINYLERTVTVAGRPITLTPTQFKLLAELSNNAGRVLTHDELLRSVWGPGHTADQPLLRSFVKGLRSKLGDNARDPVYIFTESGVGYRLAKP